MSVSPITMLDAALRAKKVGVVLHNTSPSAECIESLCMRQCMQTLGYTCDVISDFTYTEPGFSYAAYHTVITCTGILNLHADKFREHGTVIVDFIHADKLSAHQELCWFKGGHSLLDNEESHKRNTDFTWLMNGSDYASDYIETLMGRHVFPVPKLWVPALDDVRYNELTHTAPTLELVLIDFLEKGSGKWLSLVIAERLNQDYPGCIHAVHVFMSVPTEKLSIHPKVKTHSNLSLKDVLSKVNSSKNKVVFLSHQQPTALLNIHLEIVSQGYALVHNSVSLQCGYYYKDTDVLGGVKEIVKAAETHDATIDTYRQAASDVVNKYRPDHHCMEFNQLIRHHANIGIQKKVEKAAVAMPPPIKVIRPLEMKQYAPIIRKVTQPPKPAATIEPPKPANVEPQKPAAIEPPQPAAIEPQKPAAVEPPQPAVAVEPPQPVAVEPPQPAAVEPQATVEPDAEFTLVRRSRRKPKSSCGN